MERWQSRKDDGYFPQAPNLGEPRGRYRLPAKAIAEAVRSRLALAREFVCRPPEEALVHTYVQIGQLCKFDELERPVPQRRTATVTDHSRGGGEPNTL